MSEYLTRTPTSSGNRKVFTYSFWIKRHDLQYTTAAQYFLGHRNAESSATTQRFDLNPKED